MPTKTCKVVDHLDFLPFALFDTCGYHVFCSHVMVIFLSLAHVPDKKSSSWFSGFRLFLLIFFTIVILGVVCIAGFLYYTKLQEERRKRFY